MRANSSFKPIPLRGTAQLWSEAPDQVTGDSYTHELTAPDNYLKRLLLGIGCAFGLVFPTIVGVGGGGRDLLSLSIGAVMAFALSVVASSITESLIRCSRITVVLCAQALTVWGIGIMPNLLRKSA